MIVCLKLEDNEYLDAIRKYFGPTCNATVFGPLCDTLGVSLTENPLVDEVQKRASLISAVALVLQVTCWVLMSVFNILLINETYIYDKYMVEIEIYVR